MVELEKEPQTPEPIASLLYGTEKSKHFKQNTRVYNFMFAFTSMGGKVDKSIYRGRGPYCFKMQGQNSYMVESLVLVDENIPKLCQLYIYDTENEIENRINALGGNTDGVDPDIVDCLLTMLDQNNKLVQYFRMARDSFENKDLEDFKLVLISSSSTSGRPDHIGPSNEIASFIVSNDTDTGVREILLLKLNKIV